MSIPSLPAFYDMQYTIEGGRMTPDAYLYNDQTFQTLNLAVNLVNSVTESSIIGSGASSSIIANNLVAPQKTTAEIAVLELNASIGAIWFNTTLSKLQVKTATGVIETITSV